METEKSTYFFSSYYRMKWNFFKTFLSLVFFWDSTYAVVPVIWINICVWTIHVLWGSVSALQTRLSSLFSFLGKVEGKLGLLGCYSAKFLKPAVSHLWRSGQRSCTVGGRLLLNRNPTMDHRNHPNNTISDTSKSLKHFCFKRQMCQGHFLFLTWWRIML